MIPSRFRWEIASQTLLVFPIASTLPFTTPGILDLHGISKETVGRLYLEVQCQVCSKGVSVTPAVVVFFHLTAVLVPRDCTAKNRNFRLDPFMATTFEDPISRISPAAKLPTDIPEHLCRPIFRKSGRLCTGGSLPNQTR